MSRPVNLNRVRKQKTRADKKARGDANAARFGRSKVERELDAARAEKFRRETDGHKRDE
ncbi:DUF4169 family protein [Roseovarius salinarum]|uniref:DUF4169 family protein n=1 Tax=Roseovarius salinarum TaxID=1981892 RepID=UPI000C3216E6|nr:DUF4169 family protein [Roseovarius salinarum]